MADDTHTTIVEKNSNGAAIFIGFILLLAVIVGAYFLLNQSHNDNLRTEAVTSAAADVGSSAKKAGDAVDKAAK